VTPEDHAYERRPAEWHTRRDIRFGKGEVLQGTSKTPESSRISHRSTHICRQLRLCVNGSGTRLAISLPSPLQDIKDILSLVKEKARQVRLNPRPWAAAATCAPPTPRATPAAVKGRGGWPPVVAARATTGALAQGAGAGAGAEERGGGGAGNRPTMVAAAAAKREEWLN
jgi:hypothetical protein